MNEKAVCRSTPATPGLIIMPYFIPSCLIDVAAAQPLLLSEHCYQSTAARALLSDKLVTSAIRRLVATF